MDLTETRVSGERVLDGLIIKVDRDTVTLPDGNTSLREIVRHPGAAAVVPILDSGKVVMVRQYRYSIGKATLEIPAGKLDEGEEILTCAHRELKEETGYSAKRMDKLMPFVSSPGFTDEVIHIYLARGLTPGQAGGDDDEFIEIESFTIDALIEMILTGRICDGKTVAGILSAAEYLRRE